MKHFHMHVCILIAALFLFSLLVSMQVFAQETFINDFSLNPFLLEIALLTNMIRTLSSPFSIYTNNPYSSYDPYEPPYITIPNSPDYGLLPFPYKIGSTTGTNFIYRPYEAYNPVSFVNSGYPDFLTMTLSLPTIEKSIGPNLLSTFFQPSFTGAIFPFVPSGLFPGLIPNLFPL